MKCNKNLLAALWLTEDDIVLGYKYQAIEEFLSYVPAEFEDFFISQINLNSQDLNYSSLEYSSPAISLTLSNRVKDPAQSRKLILSYRPEDSDILLTAVRTAVWEGIVVTTHRIEKQVLNYYDFKTINNS